MNLINRSIFHKDGLNCYAIPRNENIGTKIESQDGKLYMFNLCISDNLSITYNSAWAVEIENMYTLDGGINGGMTSIISSRTNKEPVTQADIAIMNMMLQIDIANQFKSIDLSVADDIEKRRAKIAELVGDNFKEIRCRE